MFRAYGSSGGNDPPDQNPINQYGAFASFPKRSKPKTQEDYDEEIQIKLKRRQDKNKKILQEQFEAMKEAMTYKAVNVEDSDDSDCEPMFSTEYRAVSLTTGSVERISEKTRKALGDSYRGPTKSRKESRRRHSSSSDSSRKNKKRKRSRTRSHSRSRSNSREKKKKRSKRSRRRSSSVEEVSPSTSRVDSHGNLSRNQRIYKKPEYKLLKRITDLEQLENCNLFVYDYHLDRDNFQYDTLQPSLRSEIEPWAFLVSQIITNNGRDVGKDDRAVVKDVKKREKPARFYMIKFNQKKCENEFRIRPFPDDCDFIPLSHYNAVFKYNHEEADDKAKEEQRQGWMAEIRRDSSIPLDDDQTLMNARLNIRENPKDPSAYTAFLKAEDAAYEKRRLAGSDNSLAHSERKIAILDQGIKNCPKDATLRLERAKLIQLLYPDRAAKEWGDLLHTFVNSLALWRSYLDSMQYDTKLFGANPMENAFRKCISELNHLQNGGIRSHKMEIGTHDFQFKIFVRRLTFYAHCGFYEIAIANIQGALEFNYFCPTRFLTLGFRERRNEFQKFWESGMPRIGDKNWQGGWEQYDKAYGVRLEAAETSEEREAIQQEIQEKAQQLETLEFMRDHAMVNSIFIRAGARKLANYELWHYLERGMQKIAGRPQRNHEDVFDKRPVNNAEFFLDDYRQVPYNYLTLFALSGHMLNDLIAAFGIDLYGHNAACPSTSDLARSYGMSEGEYLLPVTGMKIILRICRHLANSANNYQFLFSIPQSYASLIPNNRSLKTRMAKFKTFVNGLKGIKGQMPKHKKKNDEDSDDDDQFDDEEESMTLLLTNPKKDVNCRLLDCFAFFAVMTTKSLQSAEPHRTAFAYMDNYLQTLQLETKLEFEIVFQMILMIIEMELRCEKKDRVKRERMLSDKLMHWVCKIGRCDQPEAEHLTLVAHTTLVNLRERKFEDDEFVLSNLGNTLPHFSALITCVGMWMSALRADPLTTAYLKDICEACGQAKDMDLQSRRALHQTLILILNREWTAHGRCKKELDDALKEHAELFPDDPKAIQLATDILATSSGLLNFSHRLDRIFGDYGGGDYGPIRRALAHIAVIEKKLEILKSIRTQDVHTIREIERFLSGLVKREAEKLNDPYFWKLAQKYAQTPAEAQEVYIRAMATCRWSREIHFNEIENAAGNQIRQSDARKLMEETQVRLLVDMSEVSIADEKYRIHREKMEEMANSVSST